MKLDEVIYSYITAPVEPSALCTTLPFVLLFGSERGVWAIDCSVIPPRGHTNAPVFDGYSIKDMLYIDQEDGDQLLVTFTSYPGEIHGYNLGTKHLLWKLTEKIPGSQDKISCRGLATDGRGQLFVSDVQNACIRVFAADGTYRGNVFFSGRSRRTWENHRISAGTVIFVP